jgi:DNA ligase-1
MNSDNMQHGHDYSGQTVDGWVASEKFDGVRGYWDGQSLWTRGGKAVVLPDSWLECLPAGVALDGELFAGNGGQRKAASAVRWGKFDSTMRFVAFDCPSRSGDWLSRLAGIVENSIVKPVTAQTVETIDHALAVMRQVQGRGGEGLMLRHPSLPYAPGRTDLMLKLKTACWH